MRNLKNSRAGFILIIVFLMVSCSDLNVGPTEQIYTQNFWNTEQEALTALTGLYEMNLDAREGKRDDLWGAGAYTVGQYTDNMRLKENYQYRYEVGNHQLAPKLWSWSYKKIARVNYFLANIDKVEMNSEEKEEMKAEAKFLRAYGYFLLSQYYGDVPFITETVSIEAANNIKQTPKEEIVDFTLTELTYASQHLPAERPGSEQGRILKSAALAIKGRLLMAEKRWSDAAQAWEEIIELGVHSIDPRFKELFEDEGDDSNEFIWAARYSDTGGVGERVTQVANVPQELGGWGETWLFKNFIDAFLMTDGQTIKNSPLYNPNRPYENRDPRFYATVLYPGYSEVNGRIFEGIGTVRDGSVIGATGFAAKKFYDEDYTGPEKQYGGDYPLIRYAEVLLSLLESKLEAGDNITQSLLDRTINEVRGREAVDMPDVTVTDRAELRSIVRRERRVELAFEAGLRYWDLRRWGIAHEVLNRKFYGMRITSNPDSYTGNLPINDEGYLLSVEKRFENPKDYLLYIPQSEIDVNDNLEQNPGY